MSPVVHCSETEATDGSVATNVGESTAGVLTVIAMAHVQVSSQQLRSGS